MSADANLAAGAPDATLLVEGADLVGPAPSQAVDAAGPRPHARTPQSLRGAAENAVEAQDLKKRFDVAESA